MNSSDKITSFSQIVPMQCGNKLLKFDNPLVMGILNITPDSFYDGGKYEDEKMWMKHTENMISEGADIIDIGALSTRPGAQLLDEDIELKRVIPVLQKLVKTFPETIFSVDTFRARVVEEASNVGVSIINDISAGSLDENMLEAVAKSGLPYILMHMKGNPTNMQDNPQYSNVMKEITSYIADKLSKIDSAGVKAVIIDPGFGFGKTIEDNYKMLRTLENFKAFRCPLLVGISRKSMIYKPLASSPDQVLHATSALHFQALLNGANILRVHDVKEAKSIIKLVELYKLS